MNSSTPVSTNATAASSLFSGNIYTSVSLSAIRRRPWNRRQSSFRNVSSASLVNYRFVVIFTSVHPYPPYEVLSALDLRGVPVADDSDGRVRRADESFLFRWRRLLLGEGGRHPRRD